MCISAILGTFTKGSGCEVSSSSHGILNNTSKFINQYCKHLHPKETFMCIRQTLNVNNFCVMGVLFSWQNLVGNCSFLTKIENIKNLIRIETKLRGRECSQGTVKRKRTWKKRVTGITSIVHLCSIARAINLQLLHMVITT